MPRLRPRTNSLIKTSARYRRRTILRWRPVPRMLTVLANRAADPCHYAVASVKKAPARRNIDYFSKRRTEECRAFRHFDRDCAPEMSGGSRPFCGLRMWSVAQSDDRPPIGDGLRRNALRFSALRQLVPNLTW